MMESEELDARFVRLREATDGAVPPSGLDVRILGAVGKLTRWETALRWCRQALVLSMVATVSLIVLAVWHDSRLANRVAVASFDDPSVGDP